MRILQLSRPTGNDTPIEETAELFSGLDMVTKPNALEPSILRAGGNVRCDANLIRTRPGFKFLAALNHDAIQPGPKFVQGCAYYDTPQIERIITAWNGRIFASAGDSFNVGATQIVGPENGLTQHIPFAQLVDRLFYVDGWIKWIKWTGSAWTYDTVSTFSNAAPMPFFSTLLAHRFRVLAVEQGTDRIYASAIGEAELPANWTATDNIRPGEGEGDPIVALVPSPAGSIYALKQGSVWALDTSDASVANWSSSNVTRQTGCIAGRTAVAVGQDVFFLSRFGVVSLGALSMDNSIAPLNTLSRPIQPYIDAINWAAVGSAWATTWRDLYILAVPTEDATTPNLLLIYNTLTGKWQPSWYTAMPGRTIDGDLIDTVGFAAGCVAGFSQKRETILGDGCGRIFAIDEILDRDQPDAATSTDIESWAVTKAWDFSEPSAPKQPFFFEAEWFRGTGREVTINLVKDAEGLVVGDPETTDMIATGVQTSETIISDLATNAISTFPIRFPWSLATRAINRLRLNVRGSRFREVSVQVICAKGRMQIRALRMSAFLDNPSLLPK